MHIATPVWGCPHRRGCRPTPPTYTLDHVLHNGAHSATLAASALARPWRAHMAKFRHPHAIVGLRSYGARATGGSRFCGRSTQSPSPCLGHKAYTLSLARADPPPSQPTHVCDCTVRQMRIQCNPDLDLQRVATHTWHRVCTNPASNNSMPGLRLGALTRPTVRGYPKTTAATSLRCSTADGLLVIAAALPNPNASEACHTSWPPAACQHSAQYWCDCRQTRLRPGGHNTP